jgi:hypothetical protein
MKALIFRKTIENDTWCFVGFNSIKKSLCKTGDCEVFFSIDKVEEGVNYIFDVAKIVVFFGIYKTANGLISRINKTLKNDNHIRL